VYKRNLYVEHEFWGLRVDIDALPEKFGQVPGAKDHVVRADSARPETISYMARNGFPRMESVRKWPGSVEDGVAFLRQFEQIVIHSRCKHAAEEARLWSYKVDDKTGEVLTALKPGNDHTWDAVRYALEPLMRTSFFQQSSFHEASGDEYPGVAA
jgi:phage terminase large subunit